MEKNKKRKALRRSRQRVTAVCAGVLAVLIAVPSSIWWIAKRNEPNDNGKLPTYVAGYGELYDALKLILAEGDVADDILDGTPEIDMEPEGGGEVERPGEDVPDDSTKGDVDYSDTNLQIVGVQESDIIKTDGRYIYAMSENCVRIIEAAGEIVTVVGNIEFVEENSTTLRNYYRAMYVEEDRLVLFYQPNAKGNSARYNVNHEIVIDIYDISDRSAPRLLESYAQDGDYVNSRMIGDKLYVISRDDIYSGDDIDRDIPESFVPAYEENGVRKLVPAEAITINQNSVCAVLRTSYIVISAIDVSGDTSLGSICAALGCGDNVYCSGDNLYLLSRYTDRTESKTDGITYVTSGTNTAVMKYSLDGDDVSFVAAGSVGGTILNQFSMDEEDGYFRIVTTERNYTTEYGFISGETDGPDVVPDVVDSPVLNGTTNSLYVLDGKMNIVGSITGLAAGERVYSVRFDGDVAYFVTYRETDPLFSVDLSNPNAPIVLGELKIPGFSNYLHPFSDGLLFGLGMDGDESGNVGNLKLSMFDVSDPANVTECAKLVVEYCYYSPASYNHKAIIVDSAKNLIGFYDQSRGVYLIYSYTDGAFVQRGMIDSGSVWSDARGLYIGDYFYICDYNGITVCSMTDFAVVNHLEFEKRPTIDCETTEGPVVDPTSTGKIEENADEMFGEISDVAGYIYDVDYENRIVYIELDWSFKCSAVGFKFDSDDGSSIWLEKHISGDDYDYFASTEMSFSELKAGTKCVVNAEYFSLEFGVGIAVTKLLEIHINADQFD